MSAANVTDAEALRLALLEMAAEVRVGATVVITEQTLLLESAVKRHASQPRTRPRPRGPAPEGPRALTGTYRTSIGSNVDKGAFVTTGGVGTNDARGPALEFGNTNAFGKGVTTLSYPHFGPALDERAGPFLAALAAVPVAAAAKTRGGRLRGFVARFFGRGA